VCVCVCVCIYIYTHTHTHTHTHTYTHYRMTRKDLVEWLTLMLRIQKIPGSNLSPETGYSDELRGFPQPLQANAGILLWKLGHCRFLPKLYKCIIHLSRLRSMLYSPNYWKASLNKLQINKYYRMTTMQRDSHPPNNPHIFFMIFIKVLTMICCDTLLQSQFLLGGIFDWHINRK
jgi:hypothetical protein